MQADTQGLPAEAGLRDSRNVCRAPGQNKTVRRGNMQAASVDDLFHKAYDSERNDLIGQCAVSIFDTQKL